MKLADDNVKPVTDYVVLPIATDGILSVMRPFVAGLNDTYDLLLSKTWPHRHRGVADCGDDWVILRGVGGPTVAIPMKLASGHCIVAVEPLVEQVENREQPLLRRRSPPSRLFLDPAVRP